MLIIFTISQANLKGGGGGRSTTLLFLHVRAPKLDQLSAITKRLTIDDHRWMSDVTIAQVHGSHQWLITESLLWRLTSYHSSPESAKVDEPVAEAGKIKWRRQLDECRLRPGYP